MCVPELDIWFTHSHISSLNCLCPKSFPARFVFFQQFVSLTLSTCGERENQNPGWQRSGSQKIRLENVSHFQMEVGEGLIGMQRWLNFTNRTNNCHFSFSFGSSPFPPGAGFSWAHYPESGVAFVCLVCLEFSQLILRLEMLFFNPFFKRNWKISSRYQWFWYFSPLKMLICS